MGLDIDWSKIREYLQGAPLPGVGVSIVEAKEIYQAIKDDPGGEIIYRPPAQETTISQDRDIDNGDLLSGLSVEEGRPVNNFLKIAVLVAAGWMLLK